MGQTKGWLEFQTPVLETRDQILQVRHQFFLCNDRTTASPTVTDGGAHLRVGVRAGATRWRNDLVNAEQHWNTRAPLKTMTLPPISFSFFDLHLLLWSSETTISPGRGELSLLAQSGLTLRNGRVTPHKKEPSGTLGLCSVAAWRILAEVCWTRSMEGRPQGGGSSYHLRWEEQGVLMGAKDVRSTWLGHGSTLSYISYQPCKNPLRSYKMGLCPNSGHLL